MTNLNSILKIRDITLLTNIHIVKAMFFPCGHVWVYQGHPDCSVGKESTCNAGDPSLILGSERSSGEGIGYPRQYSWASLVAQLVKNLPSMQETCVRSLSWEDPLEKEMATHSSILAWKIKGAWWAIQFMGLQRVR